MLALSGSFDCAVHELAKKTLPTRAAFFYSGDLELIRK